MALSDFQGVKEAAAADAAKRFGLGSLFRAKPWEKLEGGLWNKLKGVGRNVREFGRDYVFGSPLTMKDELLKRREGGASWGKALADQWKAPFYQKSRPDESTGDKWGRRLGNAVGVGLPAISLYHAATEGDPAERRGDLAAGVTGLALSPFTSRLGIPGAMIGQGISGAARKLFNHPAAKPDTNYVQPFSPVGHGKNVMWGRGGELDANNLDFNTT